MTEQFTEATHLIPLTEDEVALAVEALLAWATVWNELDEEYTKDVMALHNKLYPLANFEEPTH